VFCDRIDLPLQIVLQKLINEGEMDYVGSGDKAQLTWMTVSQIDARLTFEDIKNGNEKCFVP
jgi:hypothetical protein